MPNDPAPHRRIVVDGSNLATEGRSLPSLAQLYEAIRAFREEFPGFRSTDVIVVVDASFGHRIDQREQAAFEEAVVHGEMITPPAGAIGRGDAFILRIAEKADALVLSNDSFQEFHAERPWLFESGRLIGGKPVPGVGWIFTPRNPVRGAVSRTTTGRAKRTKKVATAEIESQTDGKASTSPVLSASSSLSSSPSRGRRRSRGATKADGNETKTNEQVTEAAGRTAKAGKVAKPAGKATKKAKSTAKKAEATASKAGATAKKAGATATKSGATTKKAEATASKTGSATTKKAKSATTKAGTTTKKAGGKAEKARGATTKTPHPTSALNEPMTFLQFVADHAIGSTFEGTVAAFTSHGAHIDVDGMRCHVPLRGLGTPTPVKARDVLSKGEKREFVLVSFDAPRRRAELALPGHVPET